MQSKHQTVRAIRRKTSYAFQHVVQMGLRNTGFPGQRALTDGAGMDGLAG